MALLASVLSIVFLFFLPSLGYELALIDVVVELGDGPDVLLALF